MSGTVAVVGATGFVGRHLMKRLIDDGGAVRGVAREPARFQGPRNSAALVQADLLHLPALEEALTDVDTVIHCAAVTADHKEAYPGQYRRVNGEGTRNLVWAAKHAGVRKIVLLNGLGTRRGKEWSYMRTRWAMGEAVGTSGLSWVAIQPSILFGDGAPYPAVLARLARRFPVMPVLGVGRKVQPIWVEDVVTCLAMAAREARWDGRAIDIGGPEQMTYGEMTDLVMKTIGVHRLKAPLPLPVARIQARLLAVLPKPPLVPATLELFDFDNTTDLNSVETNFGFVPRGIREHFAAHGLDG